MWLSRHDNLLSEWAGAAAGARGLREVWPRWAVGQVAVQGVPGWRWGRGRWAALPGVCERREEETLSRVKCVFLGGWAGEKEGESPSAERDAGLGLTTLKR